MHNTPHVLLWTDSPSPTSKRSGGRVGRTGDGLGAIGQEVARLPTALGIQVIGTKRRVAPMPDLAEVVLPERINEVPAQSDFVLLLLPATPETNNLALIALSVDTG